MVDELVLIHINVCSPLPKLVTNRRQHYCPALKWCVKIKRALARVYYRCSATHSPLLCSGELYRLVLQCKGQGLCLTLQRKAKRALQCNML